MLLLQELITIDKTSDTAVYLQITNAIIHQIRRGRLRRGLKLPGSRELAGFLRIHRKTMVAAYEELYAQGWIEMIPRKGTFVVHDLPEIKPKKITKEELLRQYPLQTIFSFDQTRIAPFPLSEFRDTTHLIIDDGFPDVREAPTKLFIRELQRLTRQGAFKKYHHYGSSKGPLYLRDTLSAFLSDTRGLPIASANVLITRGAQMGIFLAASVLLKPGDSVIVGEPSYFGATLTVNS